jgi:lysophospholipase L1-like esterase
MTSAVKALAKGLTTTAIFFLLAEIGLRGAYLVRNSMVEYVPLPYALGDNYGPIPPWLDALLILETDPVLIWKNEANIRRTYLDIFSPVRTERDRIALLRRFIPTVPSEFRDNPKWEVRLNADGFRAGEMSTTPSPSTIRIACIGDSWTYGMPVGEDQTYPSRLASWLRKERPGAKYEVLNFGVLGYSSFQGLQLLKTRVLDFDPDLVVIGFGMNDSEVPGYRDKDVVASMAPGARPRMLARTKAALTGAAEGLESYRFLKYQALALTFRPKPISEYLKARSQTPGGVVADSDGVSDIDYAELEPWTRVSPRDYESNIREMIRLVRARGADVVLVDNELWENSPYRAALKKIARETGAPFVDSLALVSDARRNIERSLEATFDLAVGTDAFPPAPAGRATVVFRVHRGSVTVPKALSIVGADPQLGELVPNTVAMHDDGTGGDQRAGDGVWTYTATLRPGEAVSYVYTNSGTAGQWEGLDVPYVRRLEVPESPDGRPVYRPIETFGRVYMQGDGWHTDAAGYDAIGHAVARAISK